MIGWSSIQILHIHLFMFIDGLLSCFIDGSARSQWNNSYSIEIISLYGGEIMHKKLVKTFFCLTLIATINTLPTLTVSAATATLGSFDLVDSGKHLDWDGNTNYMVQFKSAVNTWNAYKSGVIRKDSLSVIQDVKISDYDGDNTTILTVSSSGKIKFNQKVMDTHTNDEKKSDCLYALGIALGLGKTKNSSDVMYSYKSSKTTLSSNDKVSYDAAYKKY